MKPYFSWKTLCLLLCLALLAGCSDDDEQPDPQLPPLVWPDDVATAIPDEGFREYCLERYDRDKDGRLSKDEVLAVKKMIHFPDASGRFLSLEGIEYFSNLENFAWEYSGPKEIDLRYNSRLQKISCLYNSNLIRFRGRSVILHLKLSFIRCSIWKNWIFRDAGMYRNCGFSSIRFPR